MLTRASAVTLGPAVSTSGTAGAAARAVQKGVPAIAFSGYPQDKVPWMSDDSTATSVYSALALYITQKITDPANQTPYLPDNTWLNVNFPKVNDSQCNYSPAEFDFTLSRIKKVEANDDDTPADLQHCGSRRLPAETRITGLNNIGGGCYVSISVARGDTMEDAGSDKQKAVLARLGAALPITCISSDVLNGETS